MRKGASSAPIPGENVGVRDGISVLEERASTGREKAANASANGHLQTAGVIAQTMSSFSCLGGGLSGADVRRNLNEGNYYDQEGTRLKELNLHANNVRSMESICLGRLCFLTVLNLSSNGIRKMDPLELSSLRALAELNLASNKITMVQGLDRLFALRHLNLSFNPLTSLDGLTAVGEMHTLESLDIRGHSLSDPRSMKCFQGCHSLKKLRLSRRAFLMHPESAQENLRQGAGFSKMCVRLLAKILDPSCMVDGKPVDDEAEPAAEAEIEIETETETKGEEAEDDGFSRTGVDEVISAGEDGEERSGLAFARKQRSTKRSKVSAAKSSRSDALAVASHKDDLSTPAIDRAYRLRTASLQSAKAVEMGNTQHISIMRRHHKVNQRLRAERAELREELASMTERAKVGEAQVEDLEAEVKGLRDRLEDVLASNGKMAGDLNVAEERAQAAEKSATEKQHGMQLSIDRLEADLLAEKEARRKVEESAKRAVKASAETQKDMSALAIKYAKAEATADARREQYQSMKDSMVSFNSVIEDLRSQLQEQQRKHLEQLLEARSNSSSNDARRSEELAASQMRVQELEKQLETSSLRSTEYEEHIGALRSHLSSRAHESAGRVNDLERSVEALQAENEALRASIAKAKEEAERARAAEAQASGQSSREIRALRGALSSHEKDLEERSRMGKDLQQQLTAANRDIDKLKFAYRKLSEEHAEVTSALQETARLVHEQKSALLQLEGIEERSEEKLGHMRELKAALEKQLGEQVGQNASLEQSISALREEMATLSHERSLAAQRADGLQNNLTAKEAALEELELRAETSRVKNEKLEALVGASRGKAADLEQALSIAAKDRAAALQVKNKMLDDKDDSINSLKRRVAELEAAVESKDAQVAEFRDIEAAKEAAEEKAIAFDDIRLELEGIIEDQAAEIEAYNVDGLRSQLRQKDEALQKFEEDIHALRKRFQHYEGKIHRSKADLSASRAEIASLQSACEANKRACSAMEARAKEASEEAKASDAKCASLLQAMEKLKAENVELARAGEVSAEEVRTIRAASKKIEERCRNAEKELEDMRGSAAQVGELLARMQHR